MNDPGSVTLQRLATLEPGEQLGALLCRLDPSALSGHWLVEYTGAVQRQVAFLHARMTHAVNELGYCPPEDDLAEHAERTPGRHGGNVAAMEAHLGWGRGRAGAFDSLSYTLREEFPATWEMLRDGVIDLEAARAVTEASCLTDPSKQREVEQTVLDWIRKLLRNKRRVPPHQVRNKVNKEVVNADPEGAKQRYEQAVRLRGLRLVSSLDSVADLQLHDLSADQATVIYNYVDALAQDVKKKYGDDRTIGQLRADIAASLLSGMAEYHTDNPDDTDRADESGESAQPDEACDTEGDGTDVHHADDTDDPDEPKQHADTDEGEDQADSELESDGATEPETAADAGSAEPARRMVPPAAAPGTTRTGVRVRAKNVLHVSLTELLDLHERGKHEPAILGGYGPVIREVAERILAHHLDNPDAEYTVVVTDPRTGRPRQIHPVSARLFAGRLREVIDVRWPNCTWPTPCDKPSPMCVGDHSVDYAHGGETSDQNGNPLCGPHNREKTRNGWTQHRPDENTILWISPFGHRYTVRADDDTNGPNNADGRDPPTEPPSEESPPAESEGEPPPPF